MFWTVVREKEAVKRGKLPIQSQKSMGAEAFAKLLAGDRRMAWLARNGISTSWA